MNRQNLINRLVAKKLQPTSNAKAFCYQKAMCYSQPNAKALCYQKAMCYSQPNVKS